MPNEKNDFVKILCIVSAAMASISFVGVSIIISVYFNIPETVPASAKNAWLNAANTGIVAVVLFAFTSFSILVSLFPKSKEEKEPLSVIMRQVLKRKRLLIIVEKTHRIIAKIANNLKENAMGFLFVLFICSWFTFFIMTGFLYSAFHV